MSAQFAQHKILVVGASSGIGLGMAKAFAETGAHVALAGRTIDRLEAHVHKLKANGYKADAFAVDVTDFQSVASMYARAADQLGGLDVVCVNAGIYPSALLDVMSEADWDLVMNTNAKGTFFCVKAAVPYLEASNKARIILTSSITGPVTGIVGLSHYGASKAAQLGFMRSAALELGRKGITINAVLPGVIETEALAGLGDDFFQRSAALIPVGRLGTVGDIANAAKFFAGEFSGFVTGQTLIVDGGQTIPEAPDF